MYLGDTPISFPHITTYHQIIYPYNLLFLNMSYDSGFGEIRLKNLLCIKMGEIQRVISNFFEIIRGYELKMHIW